MLKAEHAEAVVVVGNLSPPECARELRVKYGMTPHLRETEKRNNAHFRILYGCSYDGTIWKLFVE